MFGFDCLTILIALIVVSSCRNSDVLRDVLKKPYRGWKSLPHNSMIQQF